MCRRLETTRETVRHRRSGGTQRQLQHRRVARQDRSPFTRAPAYDRAYRYRWPRYSQTVKCFLWPTAISGWQTSATPAFRIASCSRFSHAPSAMTPRNCSSSARIHHVVAGEPVAGPLGNGFMQWLYSQRKAAQSDSVRVAAFSTLPPTTRRVPFIALSNAFAQPRGTMT